jgi:hypothetical protein
VRAFGIVLRTILLLAVLATIVWSVWPEGLLSTPLAQLTIGSILRALLTIVGGWFAGMLLILWALASFNRQGLGLLD